MSTETDNAHDGSLERMVRAQLRLADPKHVPEEIAVCPECGGRLWWQVTSTDGLRDMVLDCEYEEDMGGDTEHRGWQSDWQPIFDKVKRWVVAGLRSNQDITKP